MQPIQSTPAECPYGATFVVQEKHSHVPPILGYSATVPLLKLCCDKDALVPPNSGRGVGERKATEVYLKGLKRSV
jgi:hypothetical protein